MSKRELFYKTIYQKRVTWSCFLNGGDDILKEDEREVMSEIVEKFMELEVLIIKNNVNETES